MQERRGLIRRLTDKALLNKLRQQEAVIEQQRGQLEQIKTSDGKQLKRERRRTIRHTCRVVVELPIGHSSGYGDDWSVDTLKFKGRLLDLSTGGASVFTKQAFETGQFLRLTITVPDLPDIVINARVRWVKAVPKKGAHASGVEFIRMAEEQQASLARFLERLDAQTESQ